MPRCSAPARCPRNCRSLPCDTSAAMLSKRRRSVEGGLDRGGHVILVSIEDQGDLLPLRRDPVHLVQLGPDPHRLALVQIIVAWVAGRADGHAEHFGVLALT